MKKKIVVLGGGPGLGFYVPGLIFKNQMEKNGFDVDFHAYEAFLSDNVQSKIKTTMSKFHANFKAALFSQRLAKPIMNDIDEKAVSQLIDSWKLNDYDEFYLFSGHWAPILKLYGEINSNISVNLCHIDVVNSTSWSLYDTHESFFKQIWFWDWERQTTNYYLQISDYKTIPFKNRSHEFIIHGGGWGMGTYLEKYNFLNKKDFLLDIVLYEKKDIDQCSDKKNNYYLIDEDWKYWVKDNNGNYTFPPFGKYQFNGEVIFENNRPFPEVYEILRNKLAIISKPGAGTLLDSFSSATPVITLEPFGDYEKKNGLLWSNLGFGISYQDWLETDCSIVLLEQMHHNIIKAQKNTKNFVSEICNQKLK